MAPTVAAFGAGDGSRAIRFRTMDHLIPNKGSSLLCFWLPYLKWGSPLWSLMGYVKPTSRTEVAKLHATV